LPPGVEQRTATLPTHIAVADPEQAVSNSTQRTSASVCHRVPTPAGRVPMLQSSVAVVIVLGLVVGCSATTINAATSDAAGADAPAVDAGVDVGIDAGAQVGVDVRSADGGDGGRSFACGETLRCDAGTEFCHSVSGGIRAGTRYMCAPIPAACLAAPTCACVIGGEGPETCRQEGDGTIHISISTP
jgi:hypothetical protein